MAHFIVTLAIIFTANFSFAESIGEPHEPNLERPEFWVVRIPPIRRNKDSP
jgi:hypothetical protein